MTSLAITQEMEKVCDEHKWTTIRLASGREVIVCPKDDLALLQSVLRDERFAHSLEKAIADLDAGRGQRFAKGERP